MDKHTTTLDFGNFDEALMNAPEVTQEQRERIIRAVIYHEELLAKLKENHEPWIGKDHKFGKCHTCLLIAKTEGKYYDSERR